MSRERCGSRLESELPLVPLCQTTASNSSHSERPAYTQAIMVCSLYSDNSRCTEDSLPDLEFDKTEAVCSVQQGSAKSCP